MLSQKRFFSIPNHNTIETPILLPSYSSKASRTDKVKDVLNTTKDIITDEILVSAYDSYYGHLPPQKKYHYPGRPIFVDSGGYEASTETDLFDSGKIGQEKKSWPQPYHKQALNKWDFTLPTILVSYDHPRSRPSVANQIKRAKRLFDQFPNATKELLIKIPQNGGDCIDYNEVNNSKNHYKFFDIIGFTESELGHSTLDRMIKIAKFRKMLDSIGHPIPIHIFGSLDPISSPLYFLSGADIFDGLTWLRYAYRDDLTVYKHNYGALNLGPNLKDDLVNGRTWQDNYLYLNNDLKFRLKRFLRSGDYVDLGKHHDFFKQTTDSMKLEV